MSEEHDDPSAMDFLAPNQVLTEEEKKQGIPKHPVALVFHIVFKVGAALCYLFGGLLATIFKVKQELIPLIICVIFLAFDFWTTKNVSGRLLAGLRWWNDVKPDGTNEWVFESHENETLINPYESKVFWIVLVIFPLIWGVFFISCLFSFITKLNWLMVSILALALQGSNLVGYVKCARGTHFLHTSPHIHYPFILTICPKTHLLFLTYLSPSSTNTRSDSNCYQQMHASALRTLPQRWPSMLQLIKLPTDWMCTPCPDGLARRLGRPKTTLFSAQTIQVA